MRLVKKRATKLSEEQVGSLMALIKKSIEADRRYFRLCHKLRDLLRGKHWDNATKKERDTVEVTVNLIHSHVRSLVPTLFFQEPYVEANADNILYKDRAPIWEGLINTILPRIDYKNVTKQVLLDACLYPEGWCKWVVTKEAAEDYDDENDLSSARGAQQQSGTLTETGISGPDPWFANGTPVPIRVSPLQVVVDYASPNRSLPEARFVAFRYRKLLSELKADPRYSIDSTFGEGLATPTSEKSLGRDRQAVVDFWDGGTTRANGDEYVTLYEVWVYQLVELNLYKQVVYIVEGYDKLARGPTPWSEFCGKFMGHYPINRLTLNDVPDELPVSEVSSWNSLQGALNWLLAKLLTYVKNERQLIEFDASKAVNAKKAKADFYSEKSPCLVEVNALQAFNSVQIAAPSRDNYQLVNMMTQFIQLVSGMGQNRRGLTGARTATEASIVESGTQIKTDEKVDMVGEYCRRDVQILVAILRSTIQPDFVFRATGQLGSVQWQKFTKFDADWSPDLRIRVNSFRKSTENDRMQKLQFAYNMGLQLIPVYGPMIKLDFLYGLILRELDVPYAAQISQNVVPEETTQMLELLRISVGQPVVVGPQDNHFVHKDVMESAKANGIYDALSPRAKMEFDTHLNGHDVAIQQIQASAPSKGNTTGSNTFDAESDRSDPASVANGETAGDRNGASAYPMGGRQL